MAASQPLGLEKSSFRRRFKLDEKDCEYIAARGLEVIRLHARDFIMKRLAPAVIANDGKQTPFAGHPVFKAQHATATCCRACLQKWYHIPKGRGLTRSEVERIVEGLMVWIEKKSG